MFRSLWGNQNDVKEKNLSVSIYWLLQSNLPYPLKWLQPLFKNIKENKLAKIRFNWVFKQLKKIAFQTSWRKVVFKICY